MAYRTEPFGNDAALKPGRQRHTIGFWRSHQCDGRRCNQHCTKRLHAIISFSPSR
jgi:hypothetical protein